MTPFTFTTPSRLVCAPGAATDGTLAKEAARLGARPLIVHGSSLRRSGVLEKILALLEGATTHEIPSREPTLADADAALEAARSSFCDSILAIGGGSALDVGKCAALAPLEKSAASFLCGEASADAPEALPILAVPTTAGTGSEATVSVVLTDPERVRKASFRGEALLPKAVILDAGLLRTCPKSVLACSGMDAFVQAVESYVSVGANRLTDALALEAAILTGESLPRLLRLPESQPDAGAMLLGSYLAGVALNTSRLGLVHGLAHPLGARTGAPHGLLCGLLLPHVLRFNRGADLEKSHDLAVALSAPGESLEAFALGLLDEAETPTSLSQLGVLEADLPAIAAEAMPSGSTKANPRPVREADALDVLRAAF